MTISSYQQFANLVSDSNNPNLKAITNCLGVANRICACQKEVKARKNEECNILYIKVVNTVVPTILDYFKTKTNDADIIFCHNGCHEIKRFRLR